MANLILSEAKELFEITEFPGVDRRVSSGAYTCRNFRILPGGTLEKREGFNPITTLPGIPRAIWCGNVFGEEKVFSLIDNVLYETDSQDEGSVELGSVSSVSGRADFFYCHGGLYLVDGEDIYSVSRDGVERECGYVPIYGRDWSGIVPGKVNEPVNFLSDRIIVHFKLMDVSFSYLELGIKCSEILGCTLNGLPYENDVELSNGGMRIKLSGILPAESEMCFLLRLDSSAVRRSEIRSVTRAAQSGGDSDSQVLLFGGENSSRVFALRDVDESALLMSRGMAADSTEMYFPVTDTARLGDGREAVTAVLPYGGKMLIFTENGAWISDFSTNNTPKITRLSDRVGCLAPFGVAAGKYAYTVNSSGIFRWDKVQSTLNNFSATCISGPISELFSAGFCRGAVAHYSPLHGEMWFADPNSDDQTVYVYSEETGNWYTFDPIPADRFFTLCGRTAMLCGKYLLDFSPQFKVDITIGDMEKAGPIEAVYLSPDLDFSMPDRPKRIRRIMTESLLLGEGIEIDLIGDRMKKPAAVHVACPPDGGTTYSDNRVNTGRLNRMVFRIKACGRGRVRVDKLSLAVFK